MPLKYFQYHATDLEVLILISKGGNPNVYLSTRISPETEFHSFISFDKSLLDYSSNVTALDKTDNADNGTKQDIGLDHTYLPLYIRTFLSKKHKNKTYVHVYKL